MKYFNEAHEIWQKFVPKRGQAETSQGEMLRAVEKLRDEARRNGNINWDKGFEILLHYLAEKLGDSQVFDTAVIEQSQSILRRLGNFEDPYLGNDLYDELSDRVVEYFRHYGSLPHKHNPSLGR
jgi:hypothetical protein